METGRRTSRSPLNLGDEPAEIESIDGTIELATNGARDRERVDGNFALAPAEGAIVSRG